MMYIFSTQNLTGRKKYNYQLLLKDRVWPRELEKEPFTMSIYQVPSQSKRDATAAAMVTQIS